MSEKRRSLPWSRFAASAVMAGTDIAAPVRKQKIISTIDIFKPQLISGGLALWVSRGEITAYGK